MRTLTKDGQVLDTDSPKCEHIIANLYYLDGVVFKVSQYGQCTELCDREAFEIIAGFGCKGLEAIERTGFKSCLYYHPVN